MRARPTTPPTTPPAMAPALEEPPDELDSEEDEGCSPAEAIDAVAEFLEEDVNSVLFVGINACTTSTEKEAAGGYKAYAHAGIAVPAGMSIGKDPFEGAFDPVQLVVH